MLNSNAVEQVIAATRAAASELEIAVSIAVVDDGGYLLGLVRGDGAHKLTPAMATSKAYAAAIYRRSTEDLVDLPPQLAPVAHQVGLYPPLLLPGGEPLRVEGELVGGIGVSGASPEEDARCARAGAAALG